MSALPHWVEFKVFESRGPAEALVAELSLNDVPARIEACALEGSIETPFRVLVTSDLAHRARWVVAQLPPTEAELTFLATGKLPGQL